MQSNKCSRHGEEYTKQLQKSYQSATTVRFYLRLPSNGPAGAWPMSERRR